VQRPRFIPLIRRRVESGRPENGIVGEHIVGRKVQTPLLASDRRAAFACDRERRLVSLNFMSWNQLTSWLRQIDCLQRAA
jgi:hypothetical protein